MFWSYRAIWCPDFGAVPKKSEFYSMNTKYIKLKENQCLQGTAYWKHILEEKNFRATLDISGLKKQRRLIFCCFT